MHSLQLQKVEQKKAVGVGTTTRGGRGKKRVAHEWAYSHAMSPKGVRWKLGFAVWSFVCSDSPLQGQASFMPVCSVKPRGEEGRRRVKGKRDPVPAAPQGNTTTTKTQTYTKMSNRK